MRPFSRKAVFVAAALLALSCQSQDHTRLAVTVYSDLTIPDDMDSLRVEVQGPTDTKHLDYVLATKAEVGKKVLPIQTILFPQSAKDASFTVTATGYLGTEKVVSRSARLSFLPTEARELVIFLNRDCYHKDCKDKDTNLTCKAGNCISNTVVTKDLPSYTTNVLGQPVDRMGKNSDAAAFTTDSGSETGTSPIGDAPVVLSDTKPSGDLARDLTAPPSDTLPAVVDTSLDGTLVPTPDTLPSALDTGPILTVDAGLSPDTTSPLALDTRPPADTSVPIDTSLPVDTTPPSDTPQPTPDTAIPPDTAVDAPCPTVCTAGERRCGTTGLQTCATLPNGCVGWGNDVACGVRQTCTGAAPSAQCTCTASSSASCPGAGSVTTGSFCDGQGVLQSCLRDSDGCYYLGTSQPCPTGKPCEGGFGSASCSCAAPPAPCASSPGTYCATNNTQVATCAFDPTTSCLVNTATSPCADGHSCVQTASNVAECQCPTLPECDAANEINQGYCSVNTAVTCSTDANGCQQVARTTCSAQRVCQVANNVAACNCLAANCRDSINNVFTGATCEGETQILTCGTTDNCPSTSVTATCAANTYCRASNNAASCFSTYGWYTDLGGSGSRSSSVLLGYPGTVTSNSTLSKFGLIVKSLPNTNPISVKMGLYEAGSGLLMASAEGVITVGRNEFSPSVPLQLTSGNIYWLFAIFSVDGVNVGQGTITSSRRILSQAYGNPLPATMLSSTPGTGAPSNYYVLVSP